MPKNAKRKVQPRVPDDEIGGADNVPEFPVPGAKPTVPVADEEGPGGSDAPDRPTLPGKVQPPYVDDEIGGSDAVERRGR